MQQNQQQQLQQLFAGLQPAIAQMIGAAKLNDAQAAQVAQIVREATQQNYPAAGRNPKHYLIQVDVDFTSTANEEKPKQTKGIDKDVLILGAITDLNSALVKITDDSTGYAFSNQRVNVKAIAGKSGNAVPVLPWEPYELAAGRTLSLDFKNGATGADAAGFFTFVAVQLDRKG
jgi:hypothetical protein